MATIDSTYFFRHLTVAQKSDANVSSSLSAFIDEHEDQLLLDLFGYDLYKDYKAGISVMPTPDAKWTAIRDGKEFTTRAGISTKWRGLKYTVGTAKSSLIAAYVYWYWMKNEATTTTGTGEKKPKGQNADNASPAQKMVDAWNWMVVQIEELCEFLLSNESDYPTFQEHYARIPRSLLRKQNVVGI